MLVKSRTSLATCPQVPQVPQGRLCGVPRYRLSSQRTVGGLQEYGRDADVPTAYYTNEPMNPPKPSVPFL